MHFGWFSKSFLTWTTAQTFKNGQQRRVRSLLSCIHGELILATSQTGNRHKTESRTDALRLIAKPTPGIPRVYSDATALSASGASGEEPACQCRGHVSGLIPGLGRSAGGGNGNTPVFLPGQSHRHRSLAGYSPTKESDTTDVT